MEQELAHFGIKGMHWGVRRFQQPDGTLTSAGKKRYSADRKTKLTESVEAKKAHVDAMRKQAGERIQFYGGKNVATNAIQQEAAYKKKSTTAKTVTVGTVIATGAAYAAAGSRHTVPSSCRPLYSGRRGRNRFRNVEEEPENFRNRGRADRLHQGQ